MISTEAASERFPARLMGDEFCPVKRTGGVLLAGGRDMRCLLLTLLLTLPMACEEARVYLGFCRDDCGELCGDCHEGSDSMRSRCKSFCETPLIRVPCQRPRLPEILLSGSLFGLYPRTDARP